MSHGDRLILQSKDILTGVNQFCNWFIPINFFKIGNFHIIKDGIDKKDFNQENLETFYFICAQLSLAKHFDRIKRLFYKTGNNPYGFYSLIFCDNVFFEEILVGDRFPC